MTKNKVKDIEVEETNEDIEEEFEEEMEFEELSLEDRVLKLDKKVNALIAICSLILILCTISMVVVISNRTGSSSNSQEEVVTTYDTSSFKEISMSNIKDLSKGKEIVIMIGRQGCSWCAKYAPILVDSQKTYGFETQYVDLAKIIDFSANKIIDQDAYDLMISYIKDTDFEDELIGQGIGTPMTLFVKNNKLVNAISGYVDGDSLATILENEGFSK